MRYVPIPRSISGGNGSTVERVHNALIRVDALNQKVEETIFSCFSDAHKMLHTLRVSDRLLFEKLG
ncbi:hypothetical protein SAMN05444000_13022 [Shimia gijangensis]|uniref:Uncharacterized protein n=1 Tax=Shimia gijangensis TaxID=1470563 RepID=A0A1M6SKZ5_9RHOB|nr:hypothetical protein SAMN05444000_13022 [Shimia gijangensis]